MNTVTEDDAELSARLTALTRDLVLIPSTDALPQERERCVDFVGNHLDSVPGISLTKHESNGYQSLVALPSGVSVPSILLCGHLDVVGHPERAAYRSTIRDGRIYGPGAGDMKGADAILLELFRQIHGRYPGVSLGLAFTTDEEIGGMNGVRYLVEDVGLRCGMAIIPDGGSLNDITVAEKGVLHLCVRQRGRAAHGARPWLGENALDALIERLTRLKQHFNRYRPDASEGHSLDVQTEHWFPTCSLTIITTANETVNCIPADGSATLDVRFPPPHDTATMLREVTDVLGPGCEVLSLMAAEPSHLNPDPLFQQVTRLVTGQPVQLVQASGGSDARFFCHRQIPVNVSRPLVGALHSDQEWIDIASMVQYYHICEQYITGKLGLVGKNEP